MGIVALALMPVLVILYYYYNRDRHPEPWRWVGLVFVLGAASTQLVLPLEQWAGRQVPPSPPPGEVLLFECLLVPGLIEESVKLLVVLLAVFWRRDFDEPVDGLIYGTAAALGFAFVEDWRYYLAHGPDWARVVSTVAHPWFSCFWAASLGRAKFRPWTEGVPLVCLGLMASMSVHGLFDYLIIAAQAQPTLQWLRHLLVPLMVFLYWAFEQMLDEQKEEPEVSAGPASWAGATSPAVVTIPASVDRCFGEAPATLVRDGPHEHLALEDVARLQARPGTGPSARPTVGRPPPL